MDFNTLYTRYKAGTLDPKLYEQLLNIKQEFERQRNTTKALWDRAQREKWGMFKVSEEVGKVLKPLVDKYLPQLQSLVGGEIANAFIGNWIGSAVDLPEAKVAITPHFRSQYDETLRPYYYWNIMFADKTDRANKLREIASLSLRPANFSAYQQSNQEIADLQKQIAQLQTQLQKTRSAPQPEATIQPSQPQQVGDNWELPEEGLLQTGEFATQLAKQRQQQDANLMASGLTRQQILQQRGSENIIRELGLSKMIAEQRRKSIQDWLQTVGGLQQQVRPPDFTGLREMASAFQQGTSAQQQMMMKLFENLMRQGGSQ